MTSGKKKTIQISRIGRKKRLFSTLFCTGFYITLNTALVPYPIIFLSLYSKIRVFCDVLEKSRDGGGGGGQS